MKYIKSVNIDLPNFSSINKEFELGDLTIFIGRSNSGKTRILEEIIRKLNNLKENTDNSTQQDKVKIFKDNSIDHGVILMDNIKKIIKFDYVPSPRNRISTINGLGTKLAKSANALKIIDPSIQDFGTNMVQFINNETRPLKEQGSGVQNKVQILDKLHDQNHLVLIDEPEISQFPYGKIEILRNILEELKDKQIIFATHDPTLINQYLIKKIKRNREYDIKIYSFAGDSFKKVDFLNNLDPEIHIGYLSQTYSGKPVHLIIEGQTEFYTFQALITKYCIHNKIPYFSKFINKISISCISGEQWKINIHHLPDPRYYNTLVLLDGEYSEEIQKLSEKYQDFNVIKDMKDIVDNRINIITLKNENFDKIFEPIFNKICKKPLELSEKIWSLSEEEFFNKIKPNKKDIKLIINIVKWCLRKAGYEEEKIDKVNIIKNIIENLVSNKNKKIKVSNIIENIPMNFSNSEVWEIIEKLKKEKYLDELKEGIISKV